MAKKKRKNRQRPNGSTRKRRATKLKTGTSFEDAVARIQQMFDPGSRITRREKLRDRFGHIRECDIVIRGTFGGHELVGVMECRDRSRRVEPEQVDAFANKTRNLNANLRVMVSRKGFSSTALGCPPKVGPPEKGVLSG